MNKTRVITVTNGPWRAEWYGGRLADVYHEHKSHALDCVEVGPYDFALTRDELENLRENLGRDDIQDSLDSWVEESGKDYERELPYL